MRGQFLEAIEKPDVDVIDGNRACRGHQAARTPRRHPRRPSPRRRMIFHYLRLLFARRVGATYCLMCGRK